jgi:hypothetical protein
MVSDLRWEKSHFGPGSRIGKYVLEQQIGHGGILEDARRGSVHWDTGRVCPGGRLEHASAG